MYETVLSSDKLRPRIDAARQARFAVILIFVTVRDSRLNIARVAQRRALGGHGVPGERIVARRSRSHAQFAWFAERADQVAVFDNTNTPDYAAGKVNGIWDLRDLACLPQDLAQHIRTLAAAAGC